MHLRIQKQLQTYGDICLDSFLALKDSFVGLRDDSTLYCHPNLELRFVDLFAGIGGMRLGFEYACEALGVAHKCVFSSEWDRHAQRTYRENFGETPAGDIKKISSKDIPDHEVLLAGFPCQPFSVAGVAKLKSLNRSHGFSCRRQGDLFFEIRRIIKDKRPEAFILENVKHLKNHNGGKTYEIINYILRKELGYTVYDRVYDARTVVPQHRERIFVVGFRDATTGKNFRFPELPDTNPTLKSVLEKEKVDDKYTISDRLWNYLQAYKERHKEKGNGFGYGLVDPNGVARTLSARYYKDGAEILVKQEGKNPRKLTPRECARLMGFPDWFAIPVSDTQAYKQFGNSVVVPVVFEISKAVVNTLLFWSGKI